MDKTGQTRAQLIICGVLLENNITGEMETG
jgi:hypothetical protein